MRFLSRAMLLRLLALIAASAMVATACSSSDDGDGGVDAVADEAEEAQSEEVEAGESAGEDIREDEADAGEPVHGGTLVYGIEADVANPWAPYGLTCSISCAMPLGAVSDPLFEFDPDGSIIPVLAESIESNDDATEWTLTLRDGVMNHDGTPFDAEAVAYNINLCRASSGRGQDFLLVQDVEVVDPVTVVFTLSQTWSAFPAAALDTPCGTHMMAPSWLKTLESNPLREESRFTGTDLIDQETVDTEPNGDQAAPVSMGPFQFVSFTPGNGNGMVVERFDDYWRGDGPNSITGEGLPYLDGIEFVIAVDIASRSAGLKSGEFDIMHTANADEIADFRAEGDSFVGGTATVAALSGVAFGGLVLLALWPALPWVSNFDAPTRAWTWWFVAELMPFMALTAAGVILRAGCEIRGRFVPVALAPLLRGGTVMLTIWLAQPLIGAHALPLGLVLGDVVQTVWYVGTLMSADVVPIPGITLDHRLARLGRDALPLLAGEVLVALNTVVDKAFAANLDTGSVTLLEYADRTRFIPTRPCSRARMHARWRSRPGRTWWHMGEAHDRFAVAGRPVPEVGGRAVGGARSRGCSSAAMCSPRGCTSGASSAPSTTAQVTADAFGLVRARGVERWRWERSRCGPTSCCERPPPPRCFILGDRGGGPQRALLNAVLIGPFGHQRPRPGVDASCGGSCPALYLIALVPTIRASLRPVAAGLPVLADGGVRRPDHRDRPSRCSGDRDPDVARRPGRCGSRRSPASACFAVAFVITRARHAVIAVESGRPGHSCSSVIAVATQAFIDLEVVLPSPVLERSNAPIADVAGDPARDPRPAVRSWWTARDERPSPPPVRGGRRWLSPAIAAQSRRCPRPARRPPDHPGAGAPRSGCESRSSCTSPTPIALPWALRRSRPVSADPGPSLSWATLACVAALSIGDVRCCGSRRDGDSGGWSALDWSDPQPQDPGGVDGTVRYAWVWRRPSA